MNDNLETLPLHFIIGSGRSGTTLLMMLLNNMEGICATPELKQIIYLKSKHNKNNGTANIKAIKGFLEEVQKSVTNPINNFDLKKVLNKLDGFKYSHYPELSKKIHLTLHQKTASEVSAIIDKNNLYSFYIRDLINLFPAAKFCICIRDPRGFVASNIKSQHAFKGKKSAVYFAYVWKKYNQECLRWMRKEKDKFHILKYEAFVKDPESQIKKLTSFFEIDYDSRCFSYTETILPFIEQYKQNENIDPRILKKIEDLARPIHSGATDSWKKSLSPSEKRKIEAICGDFAEELGYFNEQSIASFQKKWIQWYTKLIKWRVDLFFVINSIKLHHYLNVVRRSKHNQKREY